MTEESIGRVKEAFAELFPGEGSLIARGFDRIAKAEKDLANSIKFLKEDRASADGMSLEQVTGTVAEYKQARLKRLMESPDSRARESEDFAQIENAIALAGNDELDYEFARRIEARKKAILEMSDEEAKKEMKDFNRAIHFAETMDERVKLCTAELESLKFAALVPFVERVNAMSDAEIEAYKSKMISEILASDSVRASVSKELAQIEATKTWGGDTDETDHEVASRVMIIVDEISKMTPFDVRQSIYEKYAKRGVFNGFYWPENYEYNDFDKIAFGAAAATIDPTQAIQKLVNLIKRYLELNHSRAKVLESIKTDNMPTAIKDCLSMLKLSGDDEDRVSEQKVSDLSGVMGDYISEHFNVCREIDEKICENEDLKRCLRLRTRDRGFPELYFSQDDMEFIIGQLEGCPDSDERKAPQLATCKRILAEFKERSKGIQRVFRNPEKDYNFKSEMKSAFIRALQIIIAAYDKDLWSYFHGTREAFMPKYGQGPKTRITLFNQDVAIGNASMITSLDMEAIDKLDRAMSEYYRKLKEAEKEISRLRTELSTIETKRQEIFDEMHKISGEFSQYFAGMYLDKIAEPIDNDRLIYAIFAAAGYKTYNDFREEIKAQAATNAIVKEAELRGISVEEIIVEKDPNQRKDAAVIAA